MSEKKLNPGLVLLILLLFVMIIVMGIYIIINNISNNSYSEISNIQNSQNTTNLPEINNDTNIKDDNNSQIISDNKNNVNDNTISNNTEEAIKNNSTITNNPSSFKITKYTCLNDTNKFELPTSIDYFYGIHLIYNNNKFYLKLDSNTDLATLYESAITDALLEIQGINSDNVSKVIIADNGSDLRMPAILFLMVNGEVYFSNSFEVLTKTNNIAQKLENVSNICSLVMAVKNDSNGNIALAISKKGYAYEIYGNGTTNKIAIDTPQFLNLNLFKSLNDNGSYSLRTAHYYGLDVIYNNSKFYLKLNSNSDLSSIYPDAKINELVEIKGIDTSKIANIYIKHTGSDVRMPAILFLLEDGSVYELNSYQALTKANCIATKIDNASNVVDIVQAYSQGTPGLCSLGLRQDDTFYKF